MTSSVKDEEDDVPMYKSQGYRDFLKKAEGIEADYKAIGRAGALLLLLKFKDKSCRKYEIMRAGVDASSPQYAVRNVGLFGSKPIPGFTLGRMTEVAGQLRAACEKIVGPISDVEIDALVTEIELSPITSESLIKRLKSF